MRHLIGRKKEELLKYFSFENGLVFRNDILHLFLIVGLPECKPEGWMLFTDSSKRNLKCVLLHDRNETSLAQFQLDIP